MSYQAPYEGLRVLDVSQGFAGPYVGGMLSLYGASVIKVEPPEGDWIRGIGTSFGGQTALGVVANRGKRSIAINLKSDGGRDLVHRLAGEADVFIESFRPGVAKRLGIAYPDIRALNRRVLYLSVSGYGQHGPGAGRPATDMVIQANSGFMSVNKGMDGVPHKAGVLIADTATGVYGFQAVAAALFARERENEGRYLDISLMQSTAAFVAPKIVEYHAEQGEPRLLNAPAGSYRTEDGWIAVTLVKEHHFEKLCQAIEREDILADPRFKTFASRSDHSDAIRDLVAGVLAARTTREWLARFAQHEVLASAVSDFGDWLADPRVAEAAAAPVADQPGMGPVPIPTIPGTDPAGAPVSPALGQHGRAILRELGLDDDAIAVLVRDRAVSLTD
jgi:crotonobetainyl-CoA:carnitine CoA-transferase CaiB-like acyl-CoA transferase